MNASFYTILCIEFNFLIKKKIHLTDFLENGIKVRTKIVQAPTNIQPSRLMNWYQSFYHEHGKSLEILEKSR